MKTVKTLFLAFVATSFLFVSCNNNDDDPTPSGKYLRAKVDGVAYESNTSLLSGQAVFGQVLLSGFENASGRSFTLDFTENLAVGSYTFNGSVGNDVAAAYYPGGIAGASYGDISGNFTILEYDTVANSVKGTFNFVGVNDVNVDTINVTNGEFFMEYQQ
ncbi:MAG: hypothetical protein GC192_05505 [Bacteroidetes bacterium]|nr:hypothetical protein [Bacteroidota bacterium]